MKPTIDDIFADLFGSEEDQSSTTSSSSFKISFTPGFVADKPVRKSKPKHKDSKFDFIAIDNPRFAEAVDNYFKWKSLNDRLSSLAKRGINMPDTISEPIACYLLGFLWNRGSTGDAHVPDSEELVEFKATSSYHGDLSSFGPDEHFDRLYFLDFDLEHDILDIYRIDLDSDSIRDVMVNDHETFGYQADHKRRPRFSIYEKFVYAHNYEPLIRYNLATHQLLSDHRDEQ